MRSLPRTAPLRPMRPRSETRQPLPGQLALERLTMAAGAAFLVINVIVLGQWVPHPHLHSMLPHPHLHLHSLRLRHEQKHATPETQEEAFARLEARRLELRRSRNTTASIRNMTTTAVA